MTTPCEMAALVEAWRDRRLGEGDMASVERHVAACAACRELASDLDRLAELARGGGEPGALSELERRRNRLALLRAVARPQAERRGLPRAWQVLLVAAILVGGGLAAARTLPAKAPEVARSIEEPGDGTRIVSARGADARRGPGGLELQDGAVAIWTRAPLRVRVGETELTIRGAAVLDATAGHLDRVVVARGDTAFVAGEGPRALFAGDAWQAASPPVDANDPVPTPANDARGANDQPQTEPRARVTPTGSASAGGHASPTAPAVAVAPAVPPPPAPAAVPAAPVAATSAPTSTAAARTSPSAVAAAGRDTSFDDAVRLVELGAYDAAARRLEAFRATHPSDARAEDAAFLRIVVLDHAGRREEAKTAARLYLARFPRGFRRAEAEALAR